MKLSKLIIFLLILPITLFLDFLLFASGLKCVSCGSFQTFLASNSALSFPIVAGISGAVSIFTNKLFNKKI